MRQSEQAKADAKEIAQYVHHVEYKVIGYCHYVKRISLASIPLDWDRKRVERALIDFADGGWSPFGGYCTLVEASTLTFDVKVYTD